MRGGSATGSGNSLHDCVDRENDDDGEHAECDALARAVEMHAARYLEFVVHRNPIRKEPALVRLPYASRSTPRCAIRRQRTDTESELTVRDREKECRAAKESARRVSDTRQSERRFRIRELAWLQKPGRWRRASPPKITATRCSRSLKVMTN